MADERHNPGDADRLTGADLAASIDCIRGGAATIASIGANLDAIGGPSQRRLLELFVERGRDHADEIHALMRIISDYLRRTAP